MKHIGNKVLRNSQVRPNRRFNRRQAWMVSMASVALGTAFQIPSCSTLLTVFNPCGTVFSFCNARDIDALFGDVPDFALDPTCTIPFFGVDNPEFAAGGGGGGGIGGGGGLGGIGGSCATIEIFSQTPGPRPQGQP